ncbi:MAG: ATP-binding protein [Cyanobacteria bacterium P01_F01_bin.56]
MPDKPESSTGSNQINQDIQGHSNQSIGQVYGGSLVVYVSGGQAIFNAPATPAQPQPESSPSEGDNPYKGLAAFHESDSKRFFGRSQEINQLWHDFRALHETPSATRLLPIYGPSGSGKSSLARAGFISKLAHQPLPGREQARVAVIEPGLHPLQALATVLARIAENDPTPARKSREFAEELAIPNRNHDFDGLQRVASVLPNIETFPLIVLVDQFEEVYSLCDASQESAQRERDQFIATLLNAASDRSQDVSVIITFRSDFLGETHQHPVLNRLFSTQGFLVPTMDEMSLEAAIAQPAKAAGYALDPATTNLLIQQTVGREGTLPLLQFALTRIWENLPHEEPAQTLLKIGGVGGALADEAERIYARLSPTERAIAQRIFLGLIQLGEGTRDTRRRVEFNSLVAVAENPEQVQAVLQQFADPGVRLLTLSSVKAAAQSTPTTTVEVTHEALLEHWQRLKTWLNTGRDDLRFQQRLASAAKYWHEQRKDSGLVWRSPNLELLEDFYQRTDSHSSPLKLTPLQLEF